MAQEFAEIIHYLEVFENKYSYLSEESMADDDDDDDDEGAFVGHETISMTCSHNSRVFFSHI